MRKIGSVLLGILWAAVLASCSAQTDGPQVTYTDTGVSCLVEGYDAERLEWCYHPGPGREFLYFASPGFLGPSFQGYRSQGVAYLRDGVMKVSITADTIGDPTGLGPSAKFFVDGEGVLLESSFFEAEGKTVDLTEEDMIQAAQTLRQIIETAQDYHAAQGE